MKKEEEILLLKNFKQIQKMSTPYNVDSRLQEINYSLEYLTTNLVEMLIQNYKKSNPQENTVVDSEGYEPSFVLTDGEFENILLSLKYNGRYILKLEARHSDSPYSFTIDLDESLTDKFPEKMREELQEKFYDFEE